MQNEVKEQDEFALMRQAYDTKYITDMNQYVVKRPAYFPQRPVFTETDLRFFKMIVADVMTERFKKILKEKNLKPEDHAHYLFEVGGNTYWYNPQHQRRYHPDGTWTPIPIDRLSLFINGESGLPPDPEMRFLEMSLGYDPLDVCSYQKFGNERLADFLMSLGFLTERYRRTKKFERSPRIKAFNKKKEQAAKQMQKAAQEVLKEQAKTKKKEKESFLAKLKMMALGGFSEAEEEEYFEEVS